MNFAASGVERAIRVRAQKDQLALVRRFVEEIAREASLDPERTFDLKVAVCEACANAVEHGCEGSGFVEVRALIGRRRLTLVISDTGCFHPPSYCNESLPKRGLGLPLMVALMDKVVFARSSAGGTQVRLSLALDR
ncbi:MAG: ATP-binding protein [Thermoleophilia bacterium]|nr:ATP-binding protein [Thermoleophilia bacterium]